MILYLAILHTDYELFVLAKTKDEAQKRIIEAYKKFYPMPDRTFENPTFEELDEWFGCPIYEIDLYRGFSAEGQDKLYY